MQQLSTCAEREGIRIWKRRQTLGGNICKIQEAGAFLGARVLELEAVLSIVTKSKDKVKTASKCKEAVGCGLVAFTELRLKQRGVQGHSLLEHWSPIAALLQGNHTTIKFHRTDFQTLCCSPRLPSQLLNPCEG